MVSTRKKKQSNGRILNQVDDIDQDIVIANTVSDRQEHTTVNEATGAKDFTVGNVEHNSTVNENMVNVRTLERWFIETIDREMIDIVDTVGGKIQKGNFDRY